MAKYLAGLDYGTGGAKACIIDEEARVLSYAYREYPIIVEHPGWSEHDPRRYWEAAEELLKECIQKAGADAKEIAAIAVSSALPCLVMLDGEGEPIHKAYNLMDKRAWREAEELRENPGEKEIFALSGNRLEDHPSIVNLLWEKRNRPQAFARIQKVNTIDGYIRFKLCGRHTTNHSCGVFLGGYDIRKNVFNKELLLKIGLNPDWMPEIFACEDMVGEVHEEGALATGLARGTLVCAGQCDFNAGCIGAGLYREGDINMNLGTCGNFGVIHKDSAFLDTMLACAFTADSQSTYITIPTTTTGGGAIRYLRDLFGDAEKHLEKLTGISAYTMMDREGERVPPGSEGLLILPYLMGERTPLWNSQARGVLFGLSFHHTKGHMIRAMMEGVAYALYSSFLLMRESGKAMSYPIIFNEGGAASRLWRQIITDVFAVPTAMVENRVGAPYGDALLAGVAAGVFSDYGIARDRANYIDPLEPNEKNHRIYMEYYQLFEKLYRDVSSDFSILAGIVKGGRE